MKQQYDEHALYRQLRGAFQMTPEQERRVAQAIRQRTAAVRPAPVQTEQVVITEQPLSAKPMETRGFRLAARILPLAACLVIAVSSGVLLHRAFSVPSDSLTQQSSFLLEEQIVTAETTVQTGTTVLPAETTRSSSAAQTTVPPVTTAVQTDTETAAQTMQTAALTQTQAEIAETAAEITQTTTLQSTTAPATTTVTVTTEQETEQHDESGIGADLQEDADVVMPDLTAKPGDTVTVYAELRQNLSTPGVQFALKVVQPDNARSLILHSYTTDPDIAEMNPTWNVDDEHIRMISACAIDLPMHAGTRLLVVEYEIPADAVPGTVYRFETDGSCVHSQIDSQGEVKSIPFKWYCGSITVG